MYGDIYDDRIEDNKPPTAGCNRKKPGEDWKPGHVADHKSLKAFQREFSESGIRLSSSKIRKILITGGRWSTERSREIAGLFNLYTTHTENLGIDLPADVAIRRIAEELGVSIVTVSINLPYQNVVYKLGYRSSNAVRCARYKERKKTDLM